MGIVVAIVAAIVIYHCQKPPCLFAFLCVVSQ